jgi:hypothetical protein
MDSKVAYNINVIRNFKGKSPLRETLLKNSYKNALNRRD